MTLRRHLLPIATILVIACALFVPAIVHHEVFTFRDHTDYFQPLRYYTAEYLRVHAGTTYIGSNAKARREFGYDPRPLHDGLAETLQHELQLLGKA